MGPSGAGKDTLLALVRRELAGDPSIVFARRVITRPAQADAEDHDTLDEAEFAVLEANGGFALSWRAHGLAYGIRADILERIAEGRTVVANVSRGAVPAAERLAARVTAVNVTARPAVLAERIARRGRETAADIEARLRREASVVVTTAALAEVFNEAAPEEAARKLLAAIRGA